MQPTPAGTSGSGSGGELSRGGLARFRSAPATWLEALLEGEEEEEDPLKANQSLTQLLAGSNSSTPTSRGDSVSFASSADPGLFESGSSAGFFRQNSSPAEFLGNSGVGSDGYFSNFGIPPNYNYASQSIDTPPGSKRAREVEAQHLTAAKFPSQLVNYLLINLKLNVVSFFFFCFFFVFFFFFFFFFFCFFSFLDE
jgi:hypothetical protein